MRAEPSPAPRRHDVPPQPVDDGGFIGLLTTAQFAFAAAIGLIALTLLAIQLWPGRRTAQEEGEVPRVSDKAEV
ncbi:MAG: hypothetical protein WCD21_03170 [Streptomyces sp.]